MFHKRYMTAALLLSLSILTAGIPAQAAGKNVISGQIAGTNFHYVVWKLNGCQIPGLPETGGPGDTAPDSNQPEQPDTNQPDANQPGQPEIPDSNQPEQPDTNQPDANQPGQPEIPDSNQPEQPDTPDNNRPDAGQSSYAMQVFHLVNQERVKAGVPALTYDNTVGQAALVRAKETEVSFSHTRPNGTSFSTALQESGASFRGAGENIAYGQRSPEAVMRGWMNSPGHRANILDRNFTRMGAGYYKSAAGVNYWTQLFTY